MPTQTVTPETSATLTFDGKTVTPARHPRQRGRDGDRHREAARADRAAITLDPGYGNTGACRSAITFIDGEKGILRYRGYADRPSSPRRARSSKWRGC